MADRKINIGLGFNVDKTNLNTLKTELQSLLNMSTDDLIKIGSENAVADLKEIQTAASAVQSALEKSFNPKLNTQDLTKFQQELAMSGQSISSIKAGLDKAGVSGQNAFRNITAELLTTNRQLKQSNQWLDKMADTMANTVRWTVASSALNAVTGSIQKAYSFTKQLDTSLNDIRIVTGKSADEMARFAKEATTAAKNLGSTTTAYTKAALIYEQQGLGEADVAARSDVTTKVSNVTGQSAADVSEQLTAIWNGYKVSAAEAELYIDKVSAVAATTAADLEELSEGMGKVASAANSMGVDIDQLNASLATIISVTRQDASAVGTALKTIYARMGDLAVDGEDEFGVKLGDVSGKLKTMGIDILDAQGQMREMGEVIEEVAAKWDTWTSAQQQAAAVALAGKRQYNNLIALFENWDMYEEAKSTSKGGAGELQKQQDIYMESMEAHLNQLQTEAEELYQTLLNPEGLNPLIDALTSVVGLVENLIESLGGGAGVLRTVGAIGINVFNKQITKGITGAIHNITGFRDNLKQAAAEASIVQELELTNPENEETRQIIALAKERLKITKSMTAEEYEITNQVMKQANAAFDQKHKLEQQRDELTNIIKAHTGIEVKINDVTGEIEGAEQALRDLKNSTGEGLNRDIDTGDRALKEVEELYSFQSQVDAKQRSKSTYEGWVTRRGNDLTDATEAVSMHYMGGRDPDTENDFWEGVTTQAQYDEKIVEAKRKIAQATDELTQAQEKLNQKNEEARDGLVVLIENLQDQTKQTSFTVAEQEELKQITEDVTKVFDANGKIIDGVNGGAMQKAIDGIKRYNQILEKQKTAVDESIKNGKKFNENIRKAGEEADKASANLKKLEESFDLTKTVEDVTQLIGGITSLGSGIETLLGLGNIWSDENLTAGEKLLQTFSALGFAIPQIISGYDKLKKAWPGVVAGFQKMGAAAWASLGPYLPIVVAVAAALGVLTAAILIGVKAWNKEAEAAKKAAEAAKALGEEYKQTKVAYEELKQSITDYKDAQTAIDELTVGTEEWRDAIQDVNDKVLELIQNYPILAKYMSNENGRLVISEEGLKVAEQQKREATNVAFQKSVVAQQAANDTQLKSNATNLGREASYSSVGSHIRGGLMFGALGVLGYIINSAITGDWNPYDKATTSEEIQDVASRAQLKDNADMWSSYTEFSKALDGYSKSQIDALWENSEELKTLCKEIHANTEMNDALNATLIQTELADNQDYQNSEFQKGINQILSAQKDEAKTAALDKYDDMTKKAIMQEYANRMIASGEWKAEDVQVKRNKIVVDGKDKFVKDWDTVKNLLAEEDAWNNIGNADIQKLNNEIQKSVNSLGVFGKTLTQGAEKSKNVGEATSADYKKAQDALKNGLKDFTGDLDALGYEKISELEAALKKSVEDYEATSAVILANLDDRVEKLLYNDDGTFVISGLTLDQQRNYGEQMEAVYNNYGDSGVTRFNELFTSLGDKGIELAAAMSEVDSVEELDGFRKMLQEQGSLSEDAAKSLVTTLRFSLGLFEEYSRETAQAVAANLNKILNSVKNIGDTISPDEYDKLGEGMQKFFSLTEDGVYALNIAAEEFFKASYQERQQWFETDLAEAQKITETENKPRIQAYNAAKANRDSALRELQKLPTYAPIEPGVGILDRLGINPAQLYSANYSEMFQIDDPTLMWEIFQFMGLGNKYDSYVRDGKIAAVDLTSVLAAYGKAYNDWNSGEKRTLLEKQYNEASQIMEQNAGIIRSEEEKEVYKQAATWESLSKLQEWKKAGFIDNSTYQSQLYRFNIDFDFGIDAFEEVDRAFENTNKEIDKLQEKAENLFGDSLLNNLQSQEEQLRAGRDQLTSKRTGLKATIDSKLDEIQNSSFTGLTAALGTDWLNGLEITTDSSGRITNLEALKDAFNAQFGGDETSTKMFQAFIDKANENNALVDEWLATGEQIEEQNKLLKENALAIFDHQFKTAHEINDIKKSYNDFVQEFSLEDDDYFSQGKIATDDYALAFNDVEKSMQKIAALSDEVKKNEDGTYTINGQIFTQEEMRVAILEEGANLQEYALSLKESLTNLQELEMSQLEEIAEQYDNIVGYTESWNEFLEHGLALQELIHGENYEATKSWYEAQATAVQSQLDIQKSEYEYWKNIVAEIEAGTRSDYTYDEARTKMLESGKEVAATSAELGQVLYDNFERAWNSHFAGFDRAKSEYEWISSQAERAFDAITGALESQKLINDWTKTMNETLDESAQKRMKEFIALQDVKLKQLREENKLSQYNLDLAQAEFDLLQAQIALEDARNNKTQMRLTRGADGSYSYQYVADDQAIAQAEGQVTEAAKNRLDIVKKEMDSQVNNFYDDVSAFQNLLLEYAPDDISTEESAELNKRIQDMKLNLFDEAGNVRLEADLREAVESAAAAAGIEGYENLSLEELVTKFPEFKGYLDIINAIKEGKLETILEDGVDSAGSLNNYLVSLATTIGSSPSDTDKTLMGEIRDLLAGLTADELAGLGESIDGLEKISKAVQTAQNSFDSFATSIATVVSNIKELGTATQEGNWASLIDTIYGNASATSFLDTEEGEVVKRHNVSISWSDSDVANLNDSLTLGLQGTVKAMGELFSSVLTEKVSNISTSTKSISIQGVNLTFPAATSKEDIKDALEEWLAEIEQIDAENSK